MRRLWTLAVMLAAVSATAPGKAQAHDEPECEHGSYFDDNGHPRCYGRNAAALGYAFIGLAVVGYLIYRQDDDQPEIQLLPVIEPSRVGLGYRYAIPETDHVLGLTYERPFEFPEWTMTLRYRIRF